VSTAVRYHRPHALLHVEDAKITKCRVVDSFATVEDEIALVVEFSSAVIAWRDEAAV
jgi:hypothetical protein